MRVLRGGSFNNNTNNLRGANRNRNNPNNENNNIGFRCALPCPLMIRMLCVYGLTASIMGKSAGYSRPTKRANIK